MSRSFEIERTAIDLRPSRKPSAQLHRAAGFCFHSQMIQSTFLGSPPKSLSRVMHWPRWCCECIATCTMASLTVMIQGGSGNQGIRTVRDNVFGIQARREVVEAGVAGLGARLQVVERRRGAVLGPAGRLAAEDRQEALLNADQVVEPSAQLFVVAGGRLVPGVKEDRVGPFGVCHEVAQEGQA